MDVATRLFAAHVVSPTVMNSSNYSFELIWIFQFWPPSTVHADRAFQTETFKPFLDQFDIQTRPVSPLWHQKNIIQPRPGLFVRY